MPLRDEIEQIIKDLKKECPMGVSDAYLAKAIQKYIDKERTTHET